MASPSPVTRISTSSAVARTRMVIGGAPCWVALSMLSEQVDGWRLGRVAGVCDGEQLARQTGQPGGFRESRADCGEQFGVAAWTPQGEFKFGGQQAKGGAKFVARIADESTFSLQRVLQPLQKIVECCSKMPDFVASRWQWRTGMRVERARSRRACACAPRAEEPRRPADTLAGRRPTRRSGNRWSVRRADPLRRRRGRPGSGPLSPGGRLV